MDELGGFKLNRLKKMYKNNPILFVHLAAFVVLVTLNPITGIFSIMIGLKIPEKLSIANSSAYFAAVFYLLGHVSSLQIKKHENDESGLTRFFLRSYSRLMYVGFVVIILATIITIFS